MTITRSTLITLYTWWLLFSKVESFLLNWNHYHQRINYNNCNRHFYPCPIVAESVSQCNAKKKASSGGGSGFGVKKASTPISNQKSKRNNLIAALNDEPSNRNKARSNAAKQGYKAKTYVKAEQDAMLESLAASASKSPIGQVVANSPMHGTPQADPFWELMPSLIESKFPSMKHSELQRVAGFVKHALDPNLPLEDSIMMDSFRPHEEIHAYMPGLGETKPFHDPNSIQLCSLLSENIDVIEQEYEALLEHMKHTRKDRFQSVTSMNYDSGWKTLVLFYNGHRIPDFPYHICPTTTKLLESVPLAGRIAGFNRQMPKSGIPKHSDGNNMWLTCQMGIKVPEDGTKAFIRVGPETQYWKRGECLLYDTTYEHETFNDSESEERVVLHVDFFNTLSMTKGEIDVMRYIYSMREEFMKAEGVAKVGAQIL